MGPRTRLDSVTVLGVLNVDGLRLVLKELRKEAAEDCSFKKTS